MTDKELLQLAAKAAGVVIPKKLNNWLTYNDRYGFQWWNMDGTRTEKTFNPLTDDGDALRLAVKLNIRFNKFCPMGEAFVIAKTDAHEIYEPLLKDELLSTRRAIVRTAAEIGKAMQ
jgi:hypothetical protein